MKYCKDYAALLDLFVDGELSAEEMAQVQAHLEECPGCRAYVDDVLVIRAAFPGVEDIMVPEGFAEGVMERVRADVEAEKAKRKTRRRWLGAMVPLAACCALAVLLHSGPAMSGGGAPMMREAADSGTAGIDTQSDAGVYMGDGAGGAAAGSEEGMESSELPAEAGMESQKAGEYENQNGRAYSSLPEVLTDGAFEEDGADSQETVTAAQTPQAPAVSPAGSPQELAPESASNSDIVRERKAVLTLTAGEAGELFQSWTPEDESGSSRWYRLTEEQYQELLEALAKNGKVPAIDMTAVLPDGSMFVEVTGPF